ncbi:2-keto-3-deoxy-L-rhamnonate aldolase [Pleurostoma richardsiae]|uniref:2-keto-3-deoxy-L-rhamnonate aldolase n=1 Tax=Pleurostoma richardsiae TaxID=41990 RepID=A0AA38S836_9PEZI|nr:2-keto-3-deoxy-L-rhamnonate aldolase [Pleurostoma richardsiae]
MSAADSTTAMQRSNRLKTVFAQNSGPSMGLWQMLPGANISRALARSGVDWIVVDAEHGNIDDGAMHDAVPAIAAMGVSPIVRIPDMQPWMIKRALDTGAHGILVPLIKTVEQVRAVVAAAKFPPQGSRGFGAPLATQTFSPVPSFTEYLQQANGALLTMVQIETREALEAVEAIAREADVVFVGPFDLGNNIGFPILEGAMAPELDAAIERVLRAAKEAGSKAGIFCTSGEQARRYAEMGFDMLSVATDLTALEQVMKESVATAKGEVGPEKGKGY